MLDVTFENSPAEAFLESLKPGAVISAAQLLTLLDGDGDGIPEELFDTLAELQADLDISNLPRYKADTETAKRLRTEEQLAKQGNLQAQLEDTDPLRMYLEELAGIPACGEIGALALEVQQANAAGDLTDAHTPMLNQCLSRVVELA